MLRRVSVFAAPFPAARRPRVTGPGVPPGRGAGGARARSPTQPARRPADAGGRYLMLETVRQYGVERLEAEGETAEVRSAHLRWCIVHAERLPVEPQDDERWIREVDTLADEARTALARELPGVERQGAFRLAERIARLVFARGPSRPRRSVASSRRPCSRRIRRARGRMLVAAAGAAEARPSSAPRRSACAGRRHWAFREAGDRLRGRRSQSAREVEAMVRFRGIITPQTGARGRWAGARGGAHRSPAGDPRALARIAVAQILGSGRRGSGEGAGRARASSPSWSCWTTASAGARCSTGSAPSALPWGDLHGRLRRPPPSGIELLAPLGISPEIGVELTDALQMTAEGADRRRRHPRSEIAAKRQAAHPPVACRRGTPGGVESDHRRRRSPATCSSP